MLGILACLAFSLSVCKMGPSSSIFDQHFNPVEESVMCKDMEGTDTYLWVGIRKLFVSSTLFAEVQMNTIDIRIYHEFQKTNL